MSFLVVFILHFVLRSTFKLIYAYCADSLMNLLSIASAFSGEEEVGAHSWECWRPRHQWNVSQGVHQVYGQKMLGSDRAWYRAKLIKQIGSLLKTIQGGIPGTHWSSHLCWVSLPKWSRGTTISECPSKAKMISSCMAGEFTENSYICIFIHWIILSHGRIIPNMNIVKKRPTK